MRVYKIILLFILFFSVLHTKAQGLLFKSEDSLLTQRTSFHVFSSNEPVFHDQFFINFDLSLWDKANLGYIFNLSDKENSYSLSYLYMNGAGYLNFNIDSKSNKLKIPLRASLLKEKSWFKVKIRFDLKEDKILINVDNIAYQADKLGFKDEMTVNLVFGKNQHYTEVPNMAIKDLEVGDNVKNYFIPLNEWNGATVHDSNGETRGSVENPVWLINESYFWKQVYTHSYQDVAGLNFNPLKQNLFIFTKDSLITYNPGMTGVDSRAYENKLPVSMVLGKSIFNARENRCYIYELFDVPKGMPSLAVLNMNANNLKWNTIGRDVLPHQLHHHNIFYDLHQDKFYLFGGYGSYSYHNTFLRYNDSLDKWEKASFKGDTISPRFFSATGQSDRADELFLFGGYGNESGSQVVGGKQYYDFYRINLSSHTIKKCWSTSPDNGVFVPANNLILSGDKKYFYALCYPHEIAKTELKLYKFSVRDGSYEIVSAPVPVASMRIETDINLFYSPKTEEFFCTVQEFTDKKNSVIKIYSLASPPVSAASYQKSIRPPGKPRMALIFYILPPIFLVAAAGVWFFFLRKRNDKRTVATAMEPEPNRAPETVPTFSVEKKRNAVYLLGEFTVFDRNGNDITHLFSPKIKQLFVLILLNSKDGNGISSRRISTKLWPEKDIVKTKNIKGVTFNHMRSIISDLDGIELIFLNDTYSFRIEETFFCDFCILSDIIKKNKGSDNGSILEHFTLITRGPLLEDMPESLMDDFKSSYEEQLKSMIIPEIKRLYESRDFKLTLEMAKLILSMDAFNEEALKYQLKSFRRLKGIDYSRKAYDQFTQDYERSLGIAYHVSFETIVR